MEPMDDHLPGLSEVRGRVAAACEKAGRDPRTVTLIAVSKMVEVERIQLAYDLGQRHFGESRLQEALPKIEALPSDIVWHFIGTLQSNKAKKIAQNFNVIHSFASIAAVHEAAKAAREIDALIEINIAGESSKAGILPGEASLLVEELRQSPMRLRGLMTIGPDLGEADAMRPYFRALAEMSRSIGGEWLSMGMSGDFEVAIEEGATHIRVGSAIFGARL